MFQNTPYYPQMGQSQGFQRPAYIPQQMQQMYQQPMPQPAAQESALQVRFVASREEAVASTVLPGMPCLLVNRAADEIYFKAIDPQTGMPAFQDYARKQPEQVQAPQYATLDAVGAALQELEQRFDQKISVLQAPRQTQRKVVNANDE